MKKEISPELSKFKGISKEKKITKKQKKEIFENFKPKSIRDKIISKKQYAKTLKFLESKTKEINTLKRSYDNPRVSLQILNANRVGELGELLTSLIYQTYTEWDLILRDESTTPSIKHKHIHDIITRLKCDGHGVIYKHDKSYSNIGLSRNLCYDLDEFKNSLIIRIDDDSICEPDYIMKLVRGYQQAVSEGYNVGAVGGLVPYIGNPVIKQKLPKVFNEIVWNNEGEIIKLEDDGGKTFYFKPNQIIPSHHLRSSFLFTREAFEACKKANGFGHPVEYGFNGFREETVLSLEIRWQGFSLFTVDAIAWHLQAGGGSRQHSPQEYQHLVMVNDKHFREWCCMKFVKYGGIL